MKRKMHHIQLRMKTLLVFLLSVMAGFNSCVEKRVRLNIVASGSDSTADTAAASVAWHRMAASEDESFVFPFENDDDPEIHDAPVDFVLREAMLHLGASYQMGGKGPFSFDCSGLTRYVFGLYGFGDIGMSSHDQYVRNTPVSRDKLRPADLVFFSSPNSGHQVGHVGIVIKIDASDGTFWFIHASSSRGVRISCSHDSFFSSHYMGARRVKGA